MLKTTGPKIPFDLRAAVPRPLAWLGALLIEALVVTLLVYLARSDSYSLPEPIPVGVILERPAPPPPVALPAAPAAPDQPRGTRSGMSSGDSDKPDPKPQPSAGVSDTTPAPTPPTPAAPPTPLPPTPAASAPIEPLTKGRQGVPAAPVKSPTATAATTSGRPKPSATRAPQGRPIDLNHVEQGAGDTYLNEIRTKLTMHRLYPEQARALGLTGTGIFNILIARTGQVLDVQVVKSTGVQILDEAGIQSIHQASPLPPFPEYIQGESIQVLCTTIIGPT